MCRALGKSPLYEAIEDLVEFPFALSLSGLLGLDLFNVRGKFLLEVVREGGIKTAFPQFSASIAWKTP